MTLSDFVKEYRKEHDLSQRQFAAICGLSNGYISMLERNLNPKTGLPLTPSLPALKKISTAMGDVSGRSSHGRGRYACRIAV